MIEAFCYIVRPEENEELRYSLRSIAHNFPDVPVYIVGDKPDWVRNVNFLQGNRHTGNKPLNVWDNLTLLANWDQVPEHIVIMNDDFYILEPLEEIPVLYRGLLSDHIASLEGRTDWWARSLRNTAALFDTDALSYELHTPFPCQRSQLAQSLNMEPGDDPPQWRTLYGNDWHDNATQSKDVKVTKARHELPPGPFASTHDDSFRWTRYFLLQRFPTPSHHEGDDGEQGP